MNKRLRVMICAFVCGTLLTGCQLAKEEAELKQEKDKLIGVYMTTEYVDTFDFERYFEDNIGDIMNGGEVVIEGDEQSAYQNRIYATIVEEVSVDEVSGEKVTHQSYRFMDLEGIGYYSPVCYETEEGNSYVAIESDSGICDAKSHITGTDAGDMIELEGTIYVCPQEEDVVGVYCNPVYQCPDGSVYLVPGQGMSFSGDVEGASMSHKLEDKVTVKEKGEEKTYVNSVEMHVKTTYAPEKIIVMQMDTFGNKLDSQTYKPEKLPEEIKPLEGTEYFIVETYKQDAVGENIVSREMIGKDETFFRTLYVGDKRFCEQTWTNIQWE